MKKILNFITDHRFIIGIQAVLSIILVVSIALVNILPMRFLIVIGAFLAILTLLMYLFANLVLLNLEMFRSDHLLVRLFL